VNVGPLVVADTKASNLIEPRKCPLDDPAPSSQTAAVLGTVHRQQRQDAASSQPGSDGSGIWTGLVTAADRADGTTVHDRPRPINLVGAREPVQQCKVHQIRNARPLPIAQAPPCHPRPAPEFLRKHLPGNSAAKDEDDARQARAIRNAWSATLWPPCKNRQEGFDKIPQPIWKQRRGHTPFTLLRRRRSGSVGFVTRSKGPYRTHAALAVGRAIPIRGAYVPRYVTCT
jgi:hypothetical protein